MYEVTLDRVLRHPAITLLILILMVALNYILFTHISTSLFPTQDTGRLQGNIQADQDTSFQAMQQRLLQMIDIVDDDPAVQSLAGFTGGGGGANTARMFIALQPLNQRKLSADQVIARLRPKLAKIPGATLYLQATQDLRFGGQSANASYQYALQSDEFSDVSEWAPKLMAQMKKSRS